MNIICDIKINREWFDEVAGRVNAIKNYGCTEAFVDALNEFVSNPKNLFFLETRNNYASEKPAIHIDISPTPEFIYLAECMERGLFNDFVLTMKARTRG